MQRPEFPYRRALVTGASAGIGAALARRLADAGASELILVARRRDKLDEIARGLPCPARTVEADLATTDGIDRVLSEVAEADLLVNNAGFGLIGAFHDLDAARQADMVVLNCLAPLRLARHYLPGMVARKSGAILNVASGQSFQPVPFMTTYAATKAFLLHWAEGTRAELRGTGVRVVTVCAGATPTEFNSHAGVSESLWALKLLGSRLEDVVEGAMDAIVHDRSIVVPGFGNWALTTAGQFAPRGLRNWVVASALRGTAEKPGA